MTRARDLAKGTFSGDLTVDTNTLFVDSANNRVRVGTASPTETLDVSGNIRALGANSRVLFGPDGFEAGIKYATDASLQIASRTGEPITFTNGHDGTERLRILSTGGITFNGDTAAANALDDYEEGTFTYSLPCSVSGGYYPRAGYATGYYTKVGRIVSITLRYESQGSSSPSGQLQLSNLPFVFISTIASGSPAFGWPILIRGANNNGDFASAFFNAEPATNYGSFYKQLANGTYGGISANDVASNFEGQMCFSYVTS